MLGFTEREGSDNATAFTPAPHELTHALLHHGEEVRFGKDFRVNLRSEASGLGVDVEEIEVNFFAACLLMPRRFLEADPETATVDVEMPWQSQR